LAYENILFERRDNIAIVTINRPKALNALNIDTLKELSQAFDEIKDDSNIRVVILTGAGEKSFIAGADISNLVTFNPMDGRLFGQLGQATFRKLELLPQPVIAAINGFALGGGCELSLACDIRLAGENAKLGLPEVSLGLCPGFGGTQRLPRLIGTGYASQLTFTGDIIDANEALRIGLVNQVLPLNKLMDEALALASKIASKGPIGVQMSKSAIQRGINLDLDNALAYEAEVFSILFSTSDQKEGCSAFLEKRKAQFKNQ
jgi:enoyl-CoA hydratase